MFCSLPISCLNYLIILQHLFPNSSPWYQYLLRNHACLLFNYLVNAFWSASILSSPSLGTTRRHSKSIYKCRWISYCTFLLVSNYSFILLLHVSYLLMFAPQICQSLVKLQTRFRCYDLKWINCSLSCVPVALHAYLY